MYVYYFGVDKDGNNYCNGSKTIGEPMAYVNPRCRLPLMSVLLDPAGGIDKKSVIVPVREKLVYNRCFWLSEMDDTKASDIIDEYCRKKALEAEAREKENAYENVSGNV